MFIEYAIFIAKLEAEDKRYNGMGINWYSALIIAHDAGNAARQGDYDTAWQLVIKSLGYTLGEKDTFYKEAVESYKKWKKDNTPSLLDRIKRFIKRGK